jgi:hypothetical protein
MNCVSAEIAIEIGVLFQNGNLYACSPEQIAGHHPRRAAAHNNTAGFQSLNAIHCDSF